MTSSHPHLRWLAGPNSPPVWSLFHVDRVATPVSFWRMDVQRNGTRACTSRVDPNLQNAEAVHQNRGAVDLRHGLAVGLLKLDGVLLRFASYRKIEGQDQLAAWKNERSIPPPSAPEGPGPRRRTTRPSDRPPSNGPERLAPSRANSAAAPIVPESPSSPSSTGACLGSKVSTRPPPRAPDTRLAAACSETKPRCPTAAHAALLALPVGHRPAPAAGSANSAPACSPGLSP